MIDIPQIVQTREQLVAFVHLDVPSAEIRTHMGPGLAEVRAALAEQSIAAIGPWLTHHAKAPDSRFDVRICVPVATPIQPTGRVRTGVLPAARIARTIYCGGYERLGAGWGEFMAWIEANGHKPARDLWECYAAGPESGPDSSQWQTELNRPLLD